MQGFSVKILPAGLEIFTENRRLDLAFPGYFEYIDFLEKEKSNLSSAIQATKSKILDFAIRGKLVPQDRVLLSYITYKIMQYGQEK